MRHHAKSQFISETYISPDINLGSKVSLNFCSFSDENFELVTLKNRNIKNTLSQKVIVDVYHEENLDKILNSIEKQGE